MHQQSMERALARVYGVSVARQAVTATACPSPMRYAAPKPSNSGNAPTV